MQGIRYVATSTLFDPSDHPPPFSYRKQQCRYETCASPCMTDMNDDENNIIAGLSPAVAMKTTGLWFNHPMRLNWPPPIPSHTDMTILFAHGCSVSHLSCELLPSAVLIPIFKKHLKVSKDVPEAANISGGIFRWQIIYRFFTVAVN